MWPISTRVNKPENEDASLLDQVADPFEVWCSAFFCSEQSVHDSVAYTDPFLFTGAEDCRVKGKRIKERSHGTENVFGRRSAAPPDWSPSLPPSLL